MVQLPRPDACGHAHDGARDPRRWATAIHEAGHAVIPRKLGLRCRGAEIVGSADSGWSGSAETCASAVTMVAWAACPRRRHRPIEAAHRARIMACQAGEEAELLIIGHCPPRSAEGDLREIGGMVSYRLATPPLEVFVLEHRLRCFTRQLVLRHRAVIERVAEALIAHSELGGEDLDALVAASGEPR